MNKKCPLRFNRKVRGEYSCGEIEYDDDCIGEACMWYCPPTREDGEPSCTICISGEVMNYEP